MRRKKIIDATGVPLTPSLQGFRCQGNCKHPEYVCCCDECDYFLRCFPQYDWQYKRNALIKRIKNMFKRN